MSTGAILAGLAAAFAVCGAASVAQPLLGRAVAHGIAALGATGRIADAVLTPLRRAESEGREATRAERRRLRLAIAAGSLVLGLFTLSPVPALVVASAATFVAPRVLAWRRAAYTRRLGEGAGSAAARIADALAGGHTVRGALAMAAAELDGPIGRELSLVTADLRLGASTEAALAGFRARARSRRVDLLVAAIVLQRRSGGNLAALLRDIAAAFEDQARLDAEARAETAQARFTSTVVLAMPACVIVLAELGSPGTLGRVAGSPVAVSLVLAAALMQAAGAVLVRRLARAGT